MMIIMFLTIITLITLTLIAVLLQVTPVKEMGLGRAHALDNGSLSDFNIAVAGDWGCTPNANDTANNIINEDPELVLGLGDYSYRKNAKCWLQIVNPIDDRMKIAIGNHDAREVVNGTERDSPMRLQQYMNHFILGKQFYSFNHQNVHFIAMSTELPFEVGSDQHKFVVSDLQQASQDSTINWIVAYLHVPFYTSPNSAHSNFTPVPTSLRETYHPLFDKYGVDLVLQGHVHNYQRTFPLNYGSANSSEPIITSLNKADYTDPEGPIFAIVGTGGIATPGKTSFHNFTGSPAEFIAIQFQAFGFLNLHVSHNGTELVGEFKDNAGTIKDYFTITKLNNNGKKVISPNDSQPKLLNEYDSEFQIEPVFKGLVSPTDMTFLEQKDIMVLEKNNGTVQRIVNGRMLQEPLLDVNVSNKSERGLLGVAVQQSKNMSDYVYLYYTEANATNDKCTKPDYCLPGADPVGNRLYRYELTQDRTSLINPKILLDLPAVPGSIHNGGKTIIGPDNNLYLIIGSLMGLNTMVQNNENGQVPNLTGGILRIDQDGHQLDQGPLGTEYPLNLYYAYGIRNSFGMDFDPVTGSLWDTENGPEFGDEINLVAPGFNSGWRDVQGIWEHKGGKPQNISRSPDNLVDFDGKGKYSNPEFAFFNPVGVTAIKFLNSDKMGIQYKNDLFIGDIKYGKIYHFDLNDNRTSLLLDGKLADQVANTPDELDNVTFAKGFSGITDLEVGPDGFLYVLSYGKGTIYRISPK